jgi:hypothetical protein
LDEIDLKAAARRPDRQPNGAGCFSHPLAIIDMNEAQAFFNEAGAFLQIENFSLPPSMTPMLTMGRFPEKVFGSNQAAGSLF